MPRTNGRKFPYWHQHQIRIVTRSGMAPRARGSEEIWAGDRGRVTYWNERGETVSRDLSPEVPRDRVFDEPFLDPTAELLFRLPRLERFEPLLQDLDSPIFIERAIDVEVVENRKLALGQKIARRGHKLYKRARAAVEAAWRELTRVE